MKVFQRITQLGKRGSRLTKRLLPQPSYGRIDTLAKLHSSLPKLKFHNPPDSIGGWMTFNEQRALYSLARFSQGPVLEIGPWLGRSTICLARGIRDSGRSQPFLTCELAPTLSNFRAIDDQSVGFYYPEESQVALGVCSMDIFERDIRPVLEHPDGLLGQLRANLERMNVANFVSIHVGDFRSGPLTAYKLVFSDSMHDENEIERNAPDIKQFVSAGSILACHDSNPVNEACLRKYFRFDYSFNVDSLFVGEVSA